MSVLIVRLCHFVSCSVLLTAVFVDKANVQRTSRISAEFLPLMVILCIVIAAGTTVSCAFCMKVNGDTTRSFVINSIMAATMATTLNAFFAYHSIGYQESTVLESIRSGIGLLLYLLVVGSIIAVTLSLFGWFLARRKQTHRANAE